MGGFELIKKTLVDRDKGKSLTIIPKNYTVVDLETTGFSPRYNHIIEVGCIKIKNNEVIKKYQSLIKPPIPISSTIEYKTGIKNNMVEAAPTFESIAQILWDFLKDEIIVGHNINFDINFLYDNFKMSIDKSFSNDYVDILRLSRKLIPEIEHHGLTDLQSYFDISFDEKFENDKFLHHRAINDCLMANEILYCLGNKVLKENIDLSELFNRNSNFNFEKFDVRKIQGDENLFDKDHLFYDKNCVFTGKLEQFTRSEAAQIVANIGGHCENNVTKNTNFLIVGDM